MEEYEEVSTEYDDSDLTTGDVGLIIGSVIVCCAVIAFVCKAIKKNFKNLHLKIGNKIELGIETREDETK
jgi:hypothetical protein